MPVIFCAGLRVDLFGRELFRPIHPPDTLEKNLTPENLIGVINPEEASKVSTKA